MIVVEIPLGTLSRTRVHCSIIPEGGPVQVARVPVGEERTVHNGIKTRTYAAVISFGLGSILGRTSVTNAERPVCVPLGSATSAGTKSDDPRRYETRPSLHRVPSRSNSSDTLVRLASIVVGQSRRTILHSRLLTLVLAFYPGEG